MKRNVPWVVAVVVAILLAGCGGPSEPVGAGAGNVSFRINDLVARSVMPDVSLDAEEYRIHGDGTAGTALGASFDLVLTPADPTGNVDLLPGGWAFECAVWNDDTPAVKVGEDFATATVVVGSPQTIVFDCLPLTGEGTFAVDLTWVPDILAVPGAEAELVTFGGVSTDVPLTLTSSVAASGSIDIEQGWYTGFCRILDNGELASGIVETVRIAYGAVSTLVRYLTVNQLQGGVSFDASWTPYEQLTLTTTPVEGDVVIYNGQERVLQVTGADNDGGTTLVYAWYVNGSATAVGTSSSHTVVGDDYTTGQVAYVSAVVWQSDGKRAGDAQWKLIREDFDPNTLILTWNGTAGRNYRIQAYNAAGTLVFTNESTPVVGVDGLNTFELELLTADSYRIQISDISVGGSEFWQNKAGLATADPIAVPLATYTVFAFGNLGS